MGPLLGAKHQTVQCCGCDKLSVRYEVWRSQWDEADFDEQGRPVTRRGVKVTYHPAQTVRAKPVWAEAVGDEILRDVLGESYSALNNGQRMLASVGARTLLDRAGHILIGDVKGGFEGKRSALVVGGHISAQEKDSLDAVADAGNASAHRGYTPTAERLSRIFDIIENFLHRAFILAPAAAEIRKTTRPVRKGRDERLTSAAESHMGGKGLNPVRSPGSLSRRSARKQLRRAGPFSSRPRNRRHDFAWRTPRSAKDRSHNTGSSALRC
jgi:Domain of unknown function (DUF4145)